MSSGIVKPNMEEQINLVNEQGNRIGSIAKLEGHERGLLHEAFSIFIFNSAGELLLQKRALTKYHSGGLWTNTCCGHPRPEEERKTGAERRLFEELGIRVSLDEQYHFIYKAPLDHGLTEHELDYVFFGHFDGIPALNPEEAEDWAWMSYEDLSTDCQQKPERYTYWLKEIVQDPRFIENMLSYMHKTHL